jgi:hypothetical protein
LLFYISQYSPGLQWWAQLIPQNKCVTASCLHEWYSLLLPIKRNIWASSSFRFDLVYRVLFPQMLSPWQSGGELVMHFQIIWYCNYRVTNIEYLFRKNDVNCPMSHLCCKFPLPTFGLYVFIDVLWNLTLSCNELFIDCINFGEWMWSSGLGRWT